MCCRSLSLSLRRVGAWLAAGSVHSFYDTAKAAAALIDLDGWARRTCFALLSGIFDDLRQQPAA